MIERGEVWLRELRRLMTLMRTSSRDHWQQLRQRLSEEGEDLEGSAMADLFPDDGNIFGLIGTSGGRAFIFEFDVERDKILSDWETGEVQLSRWEEAGEESRSVNRTSLERARRVLGC
jgi:hypothetical protein